MRAFKRTGFAIVELPAMTKGFTLVELLVVITIIVILIALLLPAMDKAVYQAEKVKCLVNQRHIVQACQIYAQDQKRLFPPWKLNNDGSSAYDLRVFYGSRDGAAGVISPSGRSPLGIGLLPGGGYLPTTQLGRVIHCPTMNNLGNPNGLGPLLFAGLGMDVLMPEGWGVAGGSWFVDPAYKGHRIIAGYNYRSTSWENAKKGRLSLSNTGSGTLISIDMPDLRFTGVKREYTHPDGYNLVFADGHGSFYNDPDMYIPALILTYPGGGTMDGWNPNAADEPVYEYMAVDR